MAQTRRGSFIESILNVLIGYSIATTANWIVLPWFGLPASIAQSAGIGLILTVVSIVRSYYVRRLFVWLERTRIIA